MGIVAPILGPLAPTIVSVGIGPFGHTLVFNIEEDDINRHRKPLRRHSTSQFHQHPHTTGTVVGAIEGFAMVFLVRVVVGPKAAVPVGTQKHTRAFGTSLAGVHRSNDVLALDLGTVPQHGGEFLHNNGVAPTAHLAYKIVGAFALSLATWGAVAASHLCRYKAVGTVGIELRHLHLTVIN